MNKIQKVIGVVLVVGLLLVGAYYWSARSSTSDSPKTLGGDTINTPTNFIAGLNLGPANNQVHLNEISINIGAKTNSGYWKNTSGATRYVDLTDITTSGTASSSYLFYAYASSTLPGITYDFTNNVTATANTWVNINGIGLATSTVATTTSSFDTTAPNRTVPVASGAYYIVLMKQRFSVCTSGTCETATSTNRGFNVHAITQIHD